MKSRSSEPSLSSHQAFRGWKRAGASSSSYGLGNFSVFELNLQRKSVEDLETWMAGLGSCPSKNKIGISGNLEPKYYKQLTGGTLLSLNSCISSWENEIPKLT